MGKSIISMAIFNSYICMFTRPGNVRVYRCRSPKERGFPMIRLAAGCQNGPAQVIETPWCPGGADVGEMVFSMPGYPFIAGWFISWEIHENPIQMDDDWGYPYFSMKWDDVHLKKNFLKDHYRLERTCSSFPFEMGWWLMMIPKATNFYFWGLPSTNHRCPFPIGWLMNRGVWRNPFNNR